MVKNALRRLYGVLANRARHTRLAQTAPARYVNRFLMRRLRPNKVCYDNRCFFLDETDSLGLSVGSTDFHLLRIIKSLLKEGSVFIDAGAHIGFYAVHASVAVGETGIVHAFEPSPSNFELLQKNCKANGCGNVRCNQTAVGSRNDTIRLFLSDCSALNRVYQSELCHASIEVPMRRLDDALEPDLHNRVSLVKIDTEGWETEVLRGMPRILESSPEMIVIAEFVPRWLKEAGSSASELLDLLAGHGFAMFDLGASGAAPVLPAALIAKYTDSTQPGTDIICARAQWLDRVLQVLAQAHHSNH